MSNPTLASQAPNSTRYILETETSLLDKATFRQLLAVVLNSQTDDSEEDVATHAKLLQVITKGGLSVLFERLLISGTFVLVLDLVKLLH